MTALPFAAAVVCGMGFQLIDGFTALGRPSAGGSTGRLIASAVLLVGVAGLYSLIRTRTIRTALWVQGFQLLEQLALTLTPYCIGRSAGLSTGFGLVEPGPALWAYQAWWQITVNLAVALLLAGVMLRQVSRLVRLACGLAAVILAGEVVFVVLGANPGNGLVAVFHRFADGLVLFFRDLFVLPNAKAGVAVNYGLAAVAYFVLGQVASRFGRGQRAEEDAVADGYVEAGRRVHETTPLQAGRQL